MEKRNKHFMEYSFEDIMRLDQSLHQLAIYEVCEGMLVIPKSMEEVETLQDKTIKTFNFFKKMIQNGECSFDFIRRSVLNKYGPIPRTKLPDVESPEFLESDDKWDKKEQEKESSDRINKFMESLIKSIVIPSSQGSVATTKNKLPPTPTPNCLPTSASENKSKQIGRKKIIRKKNKISDPK